MAYLKPIQTGYRPMFHWLCEVKHNGQLSYSYPIFRPNYHYARVHSNGIHVNMLAIVRYLRELQRVINWYNELVALHPETSYGIAHKRFYMRHTQTLAVIALCGVIGSL